MNAQENPGYVVDMAFVQLASAAIALMVGLTTSVAIDLVHQDVVVMADVMWTQESVFVMKDFLDETAPFSSALKTVQSMASVIGKLANAFATKTFMDWTASTVFAQKLKARSVLVMVNV